MKRAKQFTDAADVRKFTIDINPENVTFTSRPLFRSCPWFDKKRNTVCYPLHLRIEQQHWYNPYYEMGTGTMTKRQLFSSIVSIIDQGLDADTDSTSGTKPIEQSSRVSSKEGQGNQLWRGFVSHVCWWCFALCWTRWIRKKPSNFLCNSSFMERLLFPRLLWVWRLTFSCRHLKKRNFNHR